MSDIAKVIEVVASSEEGWEEAVRTAVREASRTVRNIRGVDVQDWTARVEDGEITVYKVNVKIAFGLDAGSGEMDEGRSPKGRGRRARR